MPIDKPVIKYAGAIAVIQQSDGAINVEIRPEALNDFKELVRRATNTWPDAPQNIHEFSDIIRVGHIQQDYSRFGASK